MSEAVPQDDADLPQTRAEFRAVYGRFMHQLGMKDQRTITSEDRTVFVALVMGLLKVDAPEMSPQDVMQFRLSLLRGRFSDARLLAKYQSLAREIATW